MIKEKTVLVLGAGLSSEYNYPLDKGLRDKIIEDFTWTELSNAEQMITEKIMLLKEMDFTEGEIITFKNDLQRGGFDTIDQFLETRKDDPRMVLLGKTAIALALLSYEDESVFHDGFTDTSFYRFLFNKMEKDATEETFKENAITIITYNYDRSLEFYLWKTLQHRYRINETKANEIMKSLKIIHIHGNIGNMPWDDQYILKYGKNSVDVKPAVLDLARNGIKIYNEIDDTDDNYKEAHNNIEIAKNVVFLGFGFDSINLTRLVNGNCLDKKRRIIATAYKVSASKRVKIEEITKGKLIQGNMQNETVMPFANTHLNWL